MGLLGKIWVKLGLDNSELDKGFKDSEKSANGFQNSLKKIGGMMAAAFSVTAIINFGKKAVSEFAAAELAATKLASVLKATGGAVGLNIDQLKAYANEREKVTAVDGDAIIDAMAKLASFKSIQGDVFKGAIKSAQDLAAVWGTDLQSQILAVAKALEDPERGITALRRSGTMFTEEQIANIKRLLEEGKKQEAQMIILTEIQSQYGGAAEDAANTSIGGWKKVGVAWDNLMEKIGSGTTKTVGLAKIIENAINGIAKVLGGDFKKGSIGYFLFTNWKNAAPNKDLVAAEETMKSVTSLSQANTMLNDIRATGAEGMTKYSTELEKLLVAYVQEEKQKEKNIELEKQKIQEQKGSIKGLTEEIAKLTEERDISTDPNIIKTLNSKIDLKKRELSLIDGTAEAEARLREEELKRQMGVDGSIKRYQYLISVIDEKILKQTDRTVIESLENEKAGLENLIKTWQMTTAEAKAYYTELEAIEKMRAEGAYFPLTVPKGRASVDAKGAGSVTFGTDDSQAMTDFYDWQLEKDLKDMEAFNNKLQEETDRGAMIANQFGQAVAESISDSMKVIFDALASGEKIDSSSLIKAVLQPFASMATQIGEVMIASGAAALAMKAIAAPGGPWGAIAAGTLLVALGQAGSAAIGAIGASWGSSGQSDPYSYNGGGAMPAIAAVNSGPVEIFGVLKGQDIYLSSQKYQQNKAR